MRFPLFLSHSAETKNTGPDFNALLNQLQKAPAAGPMQFVAQIKGLESETAATNNTTCDRNKIMHAVESHCWHIEAIQRQLETVETTDANL